MSFGARMYTLLMGIHLGVELLDCRIYVCSVLVTTAKSFPLPPAVCEFPMCHILIAI